MVPTLSKHFQCSLAVILDSSDSTAIIAEDVEEEIEEVDFENVDEMLTFDPEETNINDHLT